VYTPKHFAVTDRPAQLALIERYPFGTLITARAGVVRISTLPFLIDAGGAHLRAHLARANPHWREFNDADDVVVSFVGPNAYVSPNWYRSSNMVPTWNYVVVEVRGRIELLESRDAKLDVVDRLSARHEADLPNPWRSAKMDPVLRDKLLDAIVAFRIQIVQIEAKSKLSQNRTPDDVRAAADALGARGRETAENQLATLMRAALEPK